MSTIQTETIDHFHIYSADPAATIAFYVDHFGAEQTGVKGEGEERPLYFLLLGGQLMAVNAFPPGIEPHDPPPAGNGAYTHGFGLAHFGVRVADLTGSVEALRAEGVGILTEPVTEGWLSYSYIAAPDGVVIELTQYGA